MSKENWRQLPQGDLILEKGTAIKYMTGDWRSNKPIWDKEKCINCLSCWIYCPDSSVLIEDSKMVGIDYDHCKGCGICARVCPEKVGAIDMVLEEK